MDKHENALRSIICAARGYTKWEADTPVERELIHALKEVIKTAAAGLGVDSEIVGTLLDPAIAPRKPLITDRKLRPIARA
jgi:hypothetical protein